ncbi:MAG: class I SAM-dependent methyltransferase [Candidatus Nomurabacteria bacterium]|nr:class I SAM-dependent methyltransferase [Candidatus Nomurabacteria bacterium]
MFTKPEKNILHLGLKEGMRVADFGAGTGFYSRACSMRVGYSGKVYAIEVQKDLVKKLESEINDWGISNIECIWGNIETYNGTKISDHSVNTVIISNVLFQAEDRIGVIDEARRVLKTDGKVLFIEWSDSFKGMGPDFKHIINQSLAKELFEKRGFKFEESIAISDHHYGIIFRYE